MNKRKFFTILLCLVLVLTALPMSEAKADTGVTTVTEYGGILRLMAGESTRLQVDASVNYEWDNYTVSRYAFSSNDSTIASVDASGNVKALRSGSTTILVYVYTMQAAYDYDNDNSDYDLDDDDWDWYSEHPLYGSGEEYLLFTAEYDIYVSPDLTDVKLDEASKTGYTGDAWSCPKYTFQLKSKESLTDDEETVVLYCSSSNAKISVDASLSNNVLTIQPWGTGKTTITVRINDRVIGKVQINTILLQMSTKSALLTAKQTKKLSVKGARNITVKWSSSNPSVASVSSKGMIKAKKTGNALIKAKIGNTMFGCAVSVVSASKKKTINEAIRIGKGIYSQPKRMQNGFYDCSSLVWRSYHKNGVNFGNTSYAPVAADIAKWCSQKKKMVKGGLSQKNIEHMKLNAGDLMFETGANNGRYKGIYHVEMIVGYECEGFDYNGKPIICVKWATRAPGCYGASNMPVGRP